MRGVFKEDLRCWSERERERKRKKEREKEKKREREYQKRAGGNRERFL